MKDFLILWNTYIGCHIDYFLFIFLSYLIIKNIDIRVSVIALDMVASYSSSYRFKFDSSHCRCFATCSTYTADGFSYIRNYSLIKAFTAFLSYTNNSQLIIIIVICDQTKYFACSNIEGDYNFIIIIFSHVS